MVMLRDMDLTEREEQSIMLSKDDLREFAAPFAGLASKNDFLKKHGREIVAAADSYEALIALGIWMRRVNKIAAKHRKTDPAYAAAKAERQVGRKPHTHRADVPRESNGTATHVAAAPSGRTPNAGGLGPRHSNGHGPDYVAPPETEQARMAALAHPLVPFPTQVIEQEALRNERSGENHTEGITKPPLPDPGAVINFGSG